MIEVMVSLSIVSIIAGFAFPKYLAFKIDAGRLEAKYQTKFISSLQEAYHIENQQYAFFIYRVKRQDGRLIESPSNDNLLGFRVADPDLLKYGYSSWDIDDGAGYSVNANTYHDAHNSGGRELGAGLGINPSGCWARFYNDSITLNSDGFIELNYGSDAKQQCITNPTAEGYGGL